MFTSSPRYATLVQQVARLLEAGMREGTWRDYLPGERQLAETLQVSRRTVRGAMDILRQKGLVRTVHGTETKIVLESAQEPDAAPLRAIGLLLPQPLEELYPFATVFIDSLRTLFYNNGFRVDTHIGRSFFSRHPGAALTKLVKRSPAEGWILAFSNRWSQAWFAEQKIPAVVIGSAHEGVNLAFVDIDFLATARHAVGVLVRKGHRRLACIIEDSDRPGDRQTVKGFLEGVERAGGDAVTGEVIQHNGTPVGLRRLVNRVLSKSPRPQAFFIANPYHYLAIFSLLSERGVAVPGGISLLCRDDDYSLRYLPTVPNRYVYNPQVRAKAIFSTLMSATRPEGVPREHKAILLLPEYIEGASVGLAGERTEKERIRRRPLVS